MADGPKELTELRTPLEITNRMAWALHYLRKATGVIHELRSDYIDKKDDYSKKTKAHQLAHAGQGTVAERENAAQLHYWDEYTAMVAAEKALQYAKEKKEDLKTELSELQTESKLVISEMGLAGKVG